MNLNFVDDKLDNFSSIVMKEAAEKRLQILNQVKEERDGILEQRELDCLEDAYVKIQKEIRKTDKEKNEMISRAVMESKKALLQKREEIIEEIFNNIMKRIQSFLETPDYYTFLMQNILQGRQQVGQGEIIIYINKSDVSLIDKIKQQLSEPLEIQVDQEDIIGGCKVFNKTKGTLIDDSLAAKIAQQKECFLEISGLVIDLL
ncbi:V-type ATP synthase subunit E [Petroclostridium sp. X23]|uniref:V-type ATP synthase subunit E n=1 Tax=Petroclostridium sp. X23 TaxID=3045146 RepID=UPI0024AD80DD|nr:V-type ATP synthase subunit E [Petroclostridium sp. X23]WHH61221.1 V-type ATP synthase subunit E [Petroclostridium sp. X23]